jgi:hypothetical protein
MEAGRTHIEVDHDLKIFGGEAITTALSAHSSGWGLRQQIGPAGQVCSASGWGSPVSAASAAATSWTSARMYVDVVPESLLLVCPA